MNSWLNDTVEHIRDLEDRKIDINQSEQQAEKLMEKRESNKWDLWDNINITNICIIGVLDERGVMKTIIVEAMAENFSNLKNETHIQVQEAQRIPNKMNPKRLNQDIS